MKSKLWLLAIAASMLTWQVQAQKLDKFGAEMGKKSVMGKEVRVPYTDVTSYYGYVQPGSKPDEERGGKKYYYVYVWVPAAAPELGIRMVSPVPDKLSPEKTDFVSPDYTANATDKTNYFDTWVTLERANSVTSIEDIATKGKTTPWSSYGYNDDTDELPAQPSGSKYNSLMRIVSEPSDPMKAIVMGLYRIGFTTYKTGEVQGSFVAQLGAPVKLPGVKVAKNMEDLAKQ
jgi:hypothetical protein